MAHRWVWGSWTRRVLNGLVGRVLPGGVGSGRLGQGSGAVGVPGLYVTSRCDGALVYVRSAERLAVLGTNQRAGRYALRHFRVGNRGRHAHH